MSKIGRDETDRARYWQQLVGAWEKSGLSQAAFCRRRKIKAVTFGWWKRKLRGAGRKSRRRVKRGAGRASRRRGADFVEVALPGRVLAAGSVIPVSSMAPTTAMPPTNPTAKANLMGPTGPMSSTSLGVLSTRPWHYEIALGNGRVIRLPQDFDPTVVSQLIAVVESC